MKFNNFLLPGLAFFLTLGLFLSQNSRVFAQSCYCFPTSCDAGWSCGTRSEGCFRSFCSYLLCQTCPAGQVCAGPTDQDGNPPRCVPIAPPTPPPIPNCNMNPSCSGSCTPLTSNSCSNNGTLTSCLYTAYSGGGSCTQVSAPNQTCTVNNCSPGYSCVSGTCTPPPFTPPTCSASDTSPTIGQTIQLISGNASGGVGPYSYRWQDGSGNDQDGQTVPTSYSSPGSRTATVTAKDSQNRTATCSVTINVGSFTVDINYTPSSVQANSPVTFNTVINGALPPFTYLWSDSVSGTNSTTSTTYPTTGNKKVTVSVTKGATQVTKTIQVNVGAPGNSRCYNQTPRLQGLLSTPNLTLYNGSGKFGNPGGQCVTSTDPANPLAQAGIVSFKIPTYDQLKNIYFERKASVTTGPNKIDKATQTGNVTTLDLKSGGHPDRLWNITGKLSLTDPANIVIDNNQRAVIFVDGNLEIGDMNVSSSNNRSALDFTLGNNNGVVFIVKGDVNFGRNVSRFDGVIIAQGTVCTSFDGGSGGSCEVSRNGAHSNADNGGETKQLTINGNLVSLDPSKPIKFVRNLILSTAAFPDGNDITPAEVIKVQPKYLVILKDLLSETFTTQTEDTHYALNQY